MSKVLLKNKGEMEALRDSGRHLATVMATVAERIRPGVSTAELDAVAEHAIRFLGGLPIFKGYGAKYGTPFPASICTSVNNEVVHGIPSTQRFLKEGDLIKIDMGLRYRGMVTDMARTFPVGVITSSAKRLLDTTRESLDVGIQQVRHGNTIANYGRAVQQYVESKGYSVVRDLVGHGVGFELHEAPAIPNYATSAGKKVLFCSGMAVALEPMVNMGEYLVGMKPDGWTFITGDGSLSSHFEGTILITENTTEIVTR